MRCKRTAKAWLILAVLGLAAWLFGSPGSRAALSQTPDRPTPTPAAWAALTVPALSSPDVGVDAAPSRADEGVHGSPVDQTQALRRRVLLALLRIRLARTQAAGSAIVASTPARYTVRLPVVQAGPAQTPGSLPRVAPPSATPTLLPTPTLTPLPEPTPDGVVRTARVPILMYHYISQPPEDADIYRRDLSVAPDLFAQHLDRIQAEGYTTISLYDLIRHLTRGTPLPPKPVILTFDDGYRDNYENAFPLLRERGMVATFFVVTDFIDEGRPEYLTWDMAREMQAAGMSIESHGRNHVDLRGKDDDYLVWQALGSAETIQYELGVRPRFVAYPAGSYDENTIRIFHSAGYWAGLTTIQGATHRTDNLFELRRVRIRGSTTPDDLALLLTLDW